MAEKMKVINVNGGTCMFGRNALGLYRRVLGPGIFFSFRISRNVDLFSRNFHEILNRNVEQLSRYYEILSQNFEFISRHLEFLSRNYEILSQILELVSRHFELLNKFVETY